MINPKFYLKDKKSNSPTLVYMMVSFNGNCLKLSTGIRVLSKQWSPQKQRIRIHGIQEDLSQLNKHLDLWDKKIKEAYEYFEASAKMPSKESLKSRFQELLIPKQSEESKESSGKIVYTFWEYYNIFIEDRIRSGVSKATIKDYDYTLKKFLMSFSKEYKLTFTLDSFKNNQKGIAQKFEYYLLNEVVTQKGVVGLAPNTTGKVIKNLKAFLNFCFDKGIIVPYSLKHIKTLTEQVDSVFLTVEEISSLCQLETEDDNLKAIRDMFVIGCDTGLRYSDYSRLTKEHIHNGKIRIQQKKTSDGVVIPISTRAKEILESYDFSIPSPKTITDFNKGLREVCQLAGLNQQCKVSSAKERYQEATHLPKWELVSSHTARRSFCTNLYLRGVRAELIMKISGHKTQKAFMRYLKLDNETAANELAEFID